MRWLLFNVCLYNTPVGAPGNHSSNSMAWYLKIADIRYYQISFTPSRIGSFIEQLLIWNNIFAILICCIYAEMYTYTVAFT